MILISLLLALALDRMFGRTPYWQSSFLTESVINKWLGDDTQNKHTPLWLLLFVPAVVLWLIEYFIFGSFLTFIEQTLVLFIAIGCLTARETYKSWLQAAQRDDAEACDLYEQQLYLGLLGKKDTRAEADDGTMVQQLLMLANFRFYSAVIIFFIFGGAPGALLYATVREAHRYFSCREHHYTQPTATVLHILEWVPVRLCTFGFLVVGHFSRALPVWIDLLTQGAVATHTLLWRVGRQAEIIEPEDCKTCSKMTACVHVQAGVRLVKRNLMFLLVVAAILTLGGWLA